MTTKVVMTMCDPFYDILDDVLMTFSYTHHWPEDYSILTSNSPLRNKNSVILQPNSIFG